MFRPYFSEYQRDALAQVGQSTGTQFVYSVCEWGWVSLQSLVEYLWLIFEATFRAKSGCEFSFTLLAPITNFFLKSGSIKWGALMGYSWRVSFLFLSSNDNTLILRLRSDNGRYFTQLEPSRLHYQLEWLLLVFVDNSSLCPFNIYSNSLITQVTDFYGRNDLDMVRLSFLFTHPTLVATVSRLEMVFVFFNLQ